MWAKGCSKWGRGHNGSMPCTLKLGEISFTGNANASSQLHTYINRKLLIWQKWVCPSVNNYNSRRLQRKFQNNTLKVTIVSVPPKQKHTWWQEWCPINNYTQQLCLSPMTPILLLNTYSIAICVKLERQLNSKMDCHSLQRVVRISCAKTKAI